MTDQDLRHLFKRLPRVSFPGRRYVTFRIGTKMTFPFWFCCRHTHKFSNTVDTKARKNELVQHCRFHSTCSFCERHVCITVADWMYAYSARSATRRILGNYRFLLQSLPTRIQVVAMQSWTTSVPRWLRTSFSDASVFAVYAIPSLCANFVSDFGIYSESHRKSNTESHPKSHHVATSKSRQSRDISGGRGWQFSHDCLPRKLASLPQRWADWPVHTHCDCLCRFLHMGTRKESVQSHLWNCQAIDLWKPRASRPYRKMAGQRKKGHS